MAATWRARRWEKSERKGSNEDGIGRRKEEWRKIGMVKEEKASVESV